MSIKQQLGVKIKRLRRVRGYTQEQLAEKMQIATRTLCGIENGENFVTSDTLEKFLDILQVTVSELFAIDHIRPKEELIEEIFSDIKRIDDRTKIEIIYKFVKSIITE